MKKQIFALLMAFAVIFPTVALSQTNVKISTAEKKIAESITAAQLSNYLYFVASDAMGGRDTPSQGLDVTAEFLKMQLSRWGFKPAGDDGTFFQKIALTADMPDLEKSSLKIGDKSFKVGEDYFQILGKSGASGKSVFVKDGWVVKSKGINAYDGIDVRGKVVVIQGSGFPSPRGISAPPAGVDVRSLKAEDQGKDWSDPLTYANNNGAAGIVVIASEQIQSNWERVKQFMNRSSVTPEKLRAPEGINVPVVLVTGTIGATLMEPQSVAINASSKKVTKWTQNVVAVWEGSDPVLKNEMVAIGAHYDHVGTNENARGEDKIWNGADDDGSGTVAVLSIAEALAHSKVRPKRSILFVWHCGEEKGLWGSEYFNKFPTVDIKQVIAQLNIDMIGRSKKVGDTNPKNKELSGPNQIFVIGKDMMSTAFGAVVDGTNKGYLNLDYDVRYDDPKDTNRFFFRSDHFNYAVNGIPIAFWFDGVHEDYHQPSDTADKIDYPRMEKITRTIFLTMWKLAEMNVRPKVDKTLPPELTGTR